MTPAFDKGFTITKSASADVATYRVTLSQNGKAVGTEDYAAGAAALQVAGDPTKLSFDLQGDPRWSDLQGTYDVAVEAIDAAGNSSPALDGSLTLDFVPPAPPTGFTPF